MSRFRRIIFASLTIFFVRSALAEQTSLSQSIFTLDLPNQPQRPRSFFLSPLASFFLPGFDQWYEGQYSAALFYSGGAVSGLALAVGPGLHWRDYASDDATPDGTI